jgi:hypothetical protein
VLPKERFRDGATAEAPAVDAAGASRDIRASAPNTSRIVTKIRLPSRLQDWNLPRFVQDLGAGNGADQVEIDFAGLKFAEPGCLVALLAKTQWWLQKTHTAVVFSNVEGCEAFTYLQRQDFFAHCGVDLEEKFARHDAAGRFLEIREIGPGGSVAEIATGLATCIAPDLADEWDPERTGLFDYVQYALSEVALNVEQHSLSRGFAMAQAYANSDEVYLGIADFGIGIKESFLRYGSPHVTAEMSDLEAIQKAIAPKVSSKTHLVTAWGESANAGVGLTLLTALATRVGGQITIISGSGAALLGREVVLPEERAYAGTIFAMSFPRAKVVNFARLFADAKVELGLIKRDGDVPRMFE